MSWRLALSLLASLWCAAAHAQTGCVPNPNLTPLSNSPPGYVAGCPVPPSALNTFSPNKLMMGGAFPNYTITGIQGTLAGSLPASTIDPNATLITPFAQIAVTSDTATRIGAGSGIPALGVYHSIGGAGSGAGARMGIWSDLVQNADLPSNAVPFQTGIFSNVWARSGQNGGEYYGYASQVVDDLNFSHTGLTGMEIDLSLHQVGAQLKEGLGIGSVPLTSGNDAQQGTNYSAGLGIWAGGSCGTGALAGGSGCAGFSTGISFGRSDSYIGVSSTGTLIQTTLGIGALGNLQVGSGIDFGNLKVTGNYLNMGGKWSVNGAGNQLISTTAPTVTFNDTGLSATTGGLTRLTSAGSGRWAWQVNTAVAADFSSVVTPASFNVDGTLTLQTFTVGTLPTCNSGEKGALAWVSDANGATYNGTLSAGGVGATANVLAFCNGSNWTAH